ncbi:MAG TPA: hypothetical protein VM054_02795 [bacterium]|nr:hypothetical protein [bacterium]
MVVVITSKDELKSYVKLVLSSIDETTKKLLSYSNNGLNLFKDIKFTTFGVHPKDGNTPLNLIEQVNQVFTYLTTFWGIDELKSIYTEKKFIAHLGTTGGFDIESKDDKQICAEVFATVDPENNKKIHNDLQRLREGNYITKYLFYCSPIRSGINETGIIIHPTTPERLIDWARKLIAEDCPSP